MSAQGVVNAVREPDVEAVLAIWREVLAPGEGTLGDGALGEGESGECTLGEGTSGECTLGEGTLGKCILGEDSNFFLCGGDSLDLMRVLARVRERFGVELDLREASRISTPRRMAECCLISRSPDVRVSVPPAITARSGFAGRPAVHHESENVGTPERMGIPASFPCSAGQQSLWLAEQLGDGGVYNTAVIIHFTGTLQVPVLARAASLLQYRHEVLRSSLRYDAQARQLLTHVAAPHEVVLDSEPVRPNDAREVLVEAAAQPFDLAHGPLWRFRLLQASRRRWVFLFGLHHAVTDGWSGSVLLRNLADGYRTLLNDRAWQPRCIDTEFRRWSGQHHCVSEADMDWWRVQLAGADRLPSWPRVGGARWPFTMGCETRVLPRQVYVGVQHALRLQQLRPVALFLAALRLALKELAGIDELCIGVPVNLRNGSAQDAAVGYFVNLLVLRDRIGHSIERYARRSRSGHAHELDTVHRVQHTLDEALCRRNVPFGELARQLNPAPLQSGNVWCDVLFAYQNLPQVHPDFGDIAARIEALAMPRGQHPLKVEVSCGADGYAWRIEYARECLTPDDARVLFDAMERQLAVLLAGVTRSS
ncbi:MAG: condensation domain-containing protein [Gammaproteobacteria bacterium]